MCNRSLADWDLDSREGGAMKKDIHPDLRKQWDTNVYMFAGLCALLVLFIGVVL